MLLLRGHVAVMKVMIDYLICPYLVRMACCGDTHGIRAPGKTSRDVRMVGIKRSLVVLAVLGLAPSARLWTAVLLTICSHATHPVT